MIGKLGLIVEFEIEPNSVDRFMELITENARSSIANEPGCRQFDILRVVDQPNRIILYEIYDDAEALKAHGAMPHVAAFFAAAKPLIVRQSVVRMDRLLAPAKAEA